MTSRYLCALPTLLIACGILSPSTAQADAPDVDECLAASNASLELATKHKLRAERTQLLICAAESCPGEIRQECLKRVELVNQALPSVVFEVSDSAGHSVSAVKVAMDGEVLTENLGGVAIIVDPGDHQFLFEIAGQPPLEKHLLIFEAAKNRRESIQFAATSIGTAVRIGSPPTPISAAATSTESGTSRSHRYLTYGALGVGATGLLLGTTAGIVMVTKRSHLVDQGCSSAGYCPKDGNIDQATLDSHNTWRTLSIVGFVAGGIGAVAGVTLWLSKPKTEGQPKIGLLVAPNTIGAAGTF